MKFILTLTGVGYLPSCALGALPLRSADAKGCIFQQRFNWRKERALSSVCRIQKTLVPQSESRLPICSADRSRNRRQQHPRKKRNKNKRKYELEIASR